MAQRDPAYQQARADGLIGEKTDGYLGFVTPPSPAVKALVDDLNIKRKAKYTEEALANGATVEEMAFRTGCRLIKERTAPGEMYQAPDQAAGKRVTPARLLWMCAARNLAILRISKARESNFPGLCFCAAACG
jgi:uncharacterized protein YdbL (DUF1318 family)